MENLLMRAFKAMPDIFTSREFNKKALSLGFPQRMLQRKGLAGFLRLHADNQGAFSKTWKKKSASEPVKDEILNAIPSPEPVKDEISNAISLLKSEGYKGLKPINGWEEL